MKSDDGFLSLQSGFDRLTTSLRGSFHSSGVSDSCDTSSDAESDCPGDFRPKPKARGPAATFIGGIGRPKGGGGAADGGGGAPKATDGGSAPRDIGSANGGDSDGMISDKPAGVLIMKDGIMPGLGAPASKICPAGPSANLNGGTPGGGGPRRPGGSPIAAPGGSPSAAPGGSPSAPSGGNPSAAAGGSPNAAPGGGGDPASPA